MWKELQTYLSGSSIRLQFETSNFVKLFRSPIPPGSLLRLALNDKSSFSIAVHASMLKHVQLLVIAYSIIVLLSLYERYCGQKNFGLPYNIRIVCAYRLRYMYVGPIINLSIKTTLHTYLEHQTTKP